MMQHKGYIAKVEFDDEAGVLYGEVINTSDVITFEGQSVDEVRKAFIESVEEYLRFCAERGEKPEKPFSGRLPLRMEPALHKEIAIAASRAGRSINSWIIATLQAAVDAHPVREPAEVRYIYNQIEIVGPMQVLTSPAQRFPNASRLTMRSSASWQGQTVLSLPSFEAMDIGDIVEES